MDSVNRTLYIPLFGKAYVSRRGLFLSDRKAEEIWDAEGFPLKGRSRSKWLAFYMGIRAAVFDEWVREKTASAEEGTAVIHIGCGLDSRVLRVGEIRPMWYDIDFPEVIAERRKYYEETERYRMLEGDMRAPVCLESIPERRAVVVMEGVAMYLTVPELQAFFTALCDRFEEVSLLVDCYSVFAAKMSKFKNPVKDVGVTEVHGVDSPAALTAPELAFVAEHEMTPRRYKDELHGIERHVFGRLYAGGFAKRLYRLYEYKKTPLFQKENKAADGSPSDG